MSINYDGMNKQIMQAGLQFPDADFLHKNQMAEVLKELFDDTKIDMIADLSSDELKLITRIWGLANLKDIPIWTMILKVYMKLGLSRKRESRKEIIRAIEGLARKRNLGERVKDVFTGGGG